MAVFKPPTVAPAHTSTVQGNGFVGGPRQVSLELKPWNPPLRHAAMLARKKPAVAFDRLKDRRGKAPPTPAYREPDRESAPLVEPAFDDSSVGPIVEQTPEVLQPVMFQSAEVITGRAAGEFADLSATETKEPSEIFEGAQEVTVFGQESEEPRPRRGPIRGAPASSCGLFCRPRIIESRLLHCEQVAGREEMILDGIALLFGHRSHHCLAFPHFHDSDIVHVERVEESRIVGGQDYLAPFFARRGFELICEQGKRARENGVFRLFENQRELRRCLVQREEVSVETAQPI